MQHPAMLYVKKPSQVVQCNLCAHRCTIQPSHFGICNVRQNIKGQLNTHVYGEVIAANIDPIEKKPLYHFLPGSQSFSIATPGCNFRCDFCQNWQISQLSSTDASSYSQQQYSPKEVVLQARITHCQSIAYTYTEPTIFFEYAYDTSKEAHNHGITNVFVTNGYMTSEAVDTIAPVLDAANIDLKSFRDEFYKKICKGRLQPVLDTIQTMYSHNIWIELTTLLIPGKNDSKQELNDIAEFIASLSIDIPWHISRFHPNYQITDIKPTSMKTMEQARAIGQHHGLRYIYLGNISGEPHTICPHCNAILIKRTHYHIHNVNIDNGQCTNCGTKLPGRFTLQKELL